MRFLQIRRCYPVQYFRETPFSLTLVHDSGETLISYYSSRQKAEAVATEVARRLGIFVKRRAFPRSKKFLEHQKRQKRLAHAQRRVAR
jgi:hypothetical protein